MKIPPEYSQAKAFGTFQKKHLGYDPHIAWTHEYTDQLMSDAKEALLSDIRMLLNVLTSKELFLQAMNQIP